MSQSSVPSLIAVLIASSVLARAEVPPGHYVVENLGDGHAVFDSQVVRIEFPKVHWGRKKQQGVLDFDGLGKHSRNCVDAGCLQPFASGLMDESLVHDKTHGFAELHENGNLTFWLTGHTFKLTDKGRTLTLDGKVYRLGGDKKTFRAE